MPSATFYACGDSMTPEEFAQARDRILPDWRRRFKRMPPPAMLAGLMNTVPHRLEHEVNRARGLAFDSGENGFSHTVIS